MFTYVRAYVASVFVDDTRANDRNTTYDFSSRAATGLLLCTKRLLLLLVLYYYILYDVLLLTHFASPVCEECLQIKPGEALKTRILLSVNEGIFLASASTNAYIIYYADIAWSSTAVVVVLIVRTTPVKKACAHPVRATNCNDYLVLSSTAAYHSYIAAT